MINYFRTFSCCLPLLAVSALAHAQGPELTLAQALSSAQSYWNDKIGTGVVDSEFGLSSSQGVLWPSLTAGFGVGKDFAAPLSPISQGNLYLRQDIVNLAGWKSISARSADLISRSCELQAQLILIEKNIVHLFFQLLLQQTESLVYKKNVERLNKVVELLEETTKLKLASQRDLFSAKTDLSDMKLLFLQSQTDLNSLKLQLKSQIGFLYSDSISLAEEHIESEYIPPKMDDWPILVDHFAEIIALKRRISATTLEVEAANREYLPILSLQGSYGNAALGSAPNTPSSATIMGVLTLPLFDQGTRSDKRAHAEKVKSIVEGQLSAHRNSELAEIQTSLDQIESDDKMLQIAEERLSLAEQAYEHAWTLLRLGKDGYLPIKDAERSALLAENQKSTIFYRRITNLRTLKLLVDLAKKFMKANSTGCNVESEAF